MRRIRFRCLFAAIVFCAGCAITSLAAAQDGTPATLPPDVDSQPIAEAPAVGGESQGEIVIGSGAGMAAPMGPGGQQVPNLFYNYYAPPTFGSRTAPLYLSPRPVPPHTGHTYYTYEPFLPHEWMYPHYRDYYNYHSIYQGHGVGYTSYNRTQVQWQRGNMRMTSLRRLINGAAPHKQYKKTGYGLPLTPYQSHHGYGIPTH